MGMSSSQARLLSLTGRMHDIEYKAQNLEAQKLQMANESTAVYKEYENALNATKIQLKQISNDGSITYIDATYQNMLDSGYQIKFDGLDKIIVSQATADNFVAAAGNKNYFTALETGRVTTTNQNVGGVTEIYTADQLLNMSANGNYRLMSNIDLTGRNFTSLNLNGGNFDGNGYTIKGLNKALFSSVSNSTITNLNLSGDATGQGLLATKVESNTNINNVNATGSVTSTVGATGGLIGYTSGSNITLDKCNTDIDVTLNTETELVGGLIGSASGVTITNCSTNGTLNGWSVIGGIAGNTNNCTISNTTANCDIILSGSEITRYVDSGGFIGSCVNTNISNSASYGSVNNTRQGATNGTHTVAGFIGATGGHCDITNCDSYTDVTAITDYVAGFIGCINNSTDVSNSNAFGDLNTNYVISGFIHTGTTGTIDNCYSSDTEHNFNSSGLTVTNQSSTPINNNITVTPPSIKQNTKIDNTGAEEAASLFDEMLKNGYLIEGQDVQNPAEGHENDSNWFTNMLNLGFLFLFKRDNTTGEFYQTNVATDTNLQEVQDETDLKKAEAKYEADMRKINAKDKKFDTDLAALESERNAIKTEMDTLKTVIKDNVDMTFKLFT